MNKSRAHISAAAFFAVLAVVWTFPLARHVSTHLPGGGAGDNVAFLWNFWWMRTALASGVDVFHTSYLFAPAGTDLTLHTHTALPALAGATMLGALSVVAALNVTVLCAQFLNGFCAYLLAWRTTRDHGAAVLGGIVFAGCPYVAAHLNGHFNLTMAWTIPLVVITALQATGGSARWAAAAGLTLGMTAYIDYYYVVYGFALVLCIFFLATNEYSLRWRGSTPRARRLAQIVAVVLLLDVALIAAVTATGGFAVALGPVRVSARQIFNLLQAFWIFAAAFLWLRLRPRVAIRRRASLTPRRAARVLVTIAAIFLAVAAPLVWNGVGLLARGEYVTQRYFWRSAPKGIDVATLVLGNPFNGLWGERVRRVYEAMEIDPIESTGWPGVMPAALAAWAVRRYSRSRPSIMRAATLSARAYGERAQKIEPLRAGVTRREHRRNLRQWTVVGLVFFVWALGPHLMAFGVNTGMILPQALLRYVPLAANARIPGRAMVVVYLALAVVAAIGAAHWRRRSRRATVVLLVAAAAIIADFLPAPFPLVALDRPTIYETLRDRPERGAVCELPLGIRHGFGELGAFDNRVLFYQTIHERPLVGGFVARLPRAVEQAYERDPLFTALLRLSKPDGALDAAAPLPDRRLAADRLRQNGITFVVLNRTRASAALVRYVEETLPLTLIAHEGSRSLYVVAAFESADTAQ